MQAYPAQILTINENKTFSLNTTVLKQVLLKDEIKNRRMVVVSIAGSLRKGKSFLLSFLLRYLDFTVSIITVGDIW